MLFNQADRLLFMGGERGHGMCMQASGGLMRKGMAEIIRHRGMAKVESNASRVSNGSGKTGLGNLLGFNRVVTNKSVCCFNIDGGYKGLHDRSFFLSGKSTGEVNQSVTTSDIAQFCLIKSVMWPSCSIG
jgi:hypothetical protein